MEEDETQEEGETSSKPPPFYYQLGATTLLYREELPQNSDLAALSLIPVHRYPRIKADILQEQLQRDNRIKARWNYGMDLSILNQQEQEVYVPDNLATFQEEERHRKAWHKKKGRPKQQQTKKKPKKKKGSSRTAKKKRVAVESSSDSSEDEATALTPSAFNDPRRLDRLSSARLAMLLEQDNNTKTIFSSHKSMMEEYHTYDHPYVQGFLKKQRSHQVIRVPHPTLPKSEVYHKHRQNAADIISPEYLAPFGMEALEYAQDHKTLTAKEVDRTKTTCPVRAPQGNALLTLLCPCAVCSNVDAQQRSWVLFHPRGSCMDTLCASNIIFPKGVDNAGHFVTQGGWLPTVADISALAIACQRFPNFLRLQETILEIKQAGTWHHRHDHATSSDPILTCIILVRTVSHISVVKVECTRLDQLLTNQGGRTWNHLYGNDVCSGNYVVTEQERIDLRSLRRDLPSLLPVSMATHPKYGNTMVPSGRFAFSCRHDNEAEGNIICQSLTGAGEGHLSRHTISNLKAISFIDYTQVHPMCLWTAALSHVRPTLTPTGFNKDPILGLGKSLYSVDLRCNQATFQWSPSAAERTVEGFHSISSILTNWSSNQNTVFVNSRSARKTWELDARMPCQVVNTWSITHTTDDSDITIPASGIYGEPSLLTTTTNGWGEQPAAAVTPIVNVDTTPSAFGLHLYNRPINRPRFQTDSVEAIAGEGLNFTKMSSVTTSSVFPLTGVDAEVYICGLSSIQLPADVFMKRTTTKDSQPCFLDPAGNTILNLTILSNGDIMALPIVDSTAVRVQQKVSGHRLKIPPNIDGQIMTLEHSWHKPTGGQNMKLHLTNQPHPSAKNTICRLLSDLPTGNKKIKLNKTPQTEEPTVEEPPVARDEPVLSFGPTKGGPLIIPLSLLEKSQRRLRFHTSVVQAADSTEVNKNSDLSVELLRELEDSWDGVARTIADV